MANTDTLTSLLDDVGDAIREKTGKTAKMALSEMPAEIAGISGAPFVEGAAPPYPDAWTCVYSVSLGNISPSHTNFVNAIDEAAVIAGYQKIKQTFDVWLWSGYTYDASAQYPLNTKQPKHPDAATSPQDITESIITVTDNTGGLHAYVVSMGYGSMSFSPGVGAGGAGIDAALRGSNTLSAIDSLPTPYDWTIQVWKRASVSYLATEPGTIVKTADGYAVADTETA